MYKIFLSLILITSLDVNSMHHESHDHSPKDAKSVVKQAYETFGSGDTEAWAALHADDLVFTVFGNIATSGMHIGPEASGPICIPLVAIFPKTVNTRSSA